MRLEIISEDNMLDLKSNLPALVKNFTKPDNNWLLDYFGANPFISTRFEINRIELDMSCEKPFLTDAENVKRVYGSLSFLSNSQASEEKLWAGLCLGAFWDYTKYRWNPVSVQNIKDHFFFGQGPRRSLTRNALARLWWIGRLTYDETREDPYELTNFICEHSDYILHVLERNTSNNPVILKTFLKAVLDCRGKSIPIDTNIVGELSKYLNLLGGTYLVDCMPEGVLYEKLSNKLTEINFNKG